MKNVRINYRSANDCLLSVLDSEGKLHDFRWLFAAYVNEEHPFIDSILTDIMSQGVVSKITGYQKDAKSVVQQVEAIWYYALERGISYSSISCTSSPTERANVQHIRFFDQVYNTRQLKPVIFVEPCHAYLGYYTDNHRRKLQLMETTMTSWVDFPALTRNYNETMQNNPQAKGAERISAAMNAKYTKYLSAADKKRWEEGTLSFESFKRAVAHTIFVKATDYDKENYKNNRKYFTNPSNPTYQQLDIELLRKMVQPING